MDGWHILREAITQRNTQLRSKNRSSVDCIKVEVVIECCTKAEDSPHFFFTLAISKSMVRLSEDPVGERGKFSHELSVMYLPRSNQKGVEKIDQSKVFPNLSMPRSGSLKNFPSDFRRIPAWIHP